MEKLVYSPYESFARRYNRFGELYGDITKVIYPCRHMAATAVNGLKSMGGVFPHPVYH